MAKKIKARNSKIHGKGVFATKKIKKGERVCRYKGRLLTTEESDHIYGGNADSGHTFLFTLNDEYVVDANVQGGIAKWINHGCDPNCETVIYESHKKDLQKDKVVVEAIRNIKPGEELVYKYDIGVEGGMTKKERDQWACKCGSKKCTGTMLEK